MPENPKPQTPKRPLVGKAVVTVQVAYFDGLTEAPVYNETERVNLYEGQKLADEAARKVGELADHVKQLSR